MSQQNHLGTVGTIQNLAPAGSTVNGLPTMTGSDGLVHPVYSAYSGLSYDVNSNLLGYSYKFSYYTQVPQNGSQWTPMSGTVAYAFSNAEVLTSEIWSGSISKSYTYSESAGNLSTLRGISFGTNTSLDQITTSGAIGVNTTSNSSETYAGLVYDLEGNMTQFRGLTATYSPDGTMATTSTPPFYDTHGNLILSSGTYNWSYDAEGRLTTADSVYDGDQLVAQNGVFYVWGPTGPVLAIEHGQEIESLTYDPAGSLIHIVKPPSQTASYASTYVFDAYGLPIDYWPSVWTQYQYNNVIYYEAADEIALLYKGQAGYDTAYGWSEYKASDGSLVYDSALINCGARWYDPFSGRWLTRDPAGLEGGENAYEYCGGNPLMRVDPSGLQDVDGSSALQLSENAESVELEVVEGGAGNGGEIGFLCSLAAAAGFAIGTEIDHGLHISEGAGNLTTWIVSRDKRYEDSYEVLKRVWLAAGPEQRAELEDQYLFLKEYAQKYLDYPQREIAIHHLLPQQFIGWFSSGTRRFFIHSHEHTVPLPAWLHRIVHSAGYNKDWELFIRRHPNASRQEVLDKLANLRMKYNI